MVPAARHRSTTWAPATGPLVTRTTSRCSESAAGDAARRVGVLGEEEAGRARAGDQAAQRAAALAELQQVGQVGAQVEGGRLEVVVQRARQELGVAGRERRAGRPGRRRLRGRVRAELVEAPVDRRAWTARRPRAPRPTTTWPASGTGSTSSPRPVPSAVPPTSANGTSLPSSAASASRSSSGVSSPHSRSSATSAAAASAEPPAMPPATGIDLAIETAACEAMPWCSASSRAARSTMLSPVTRHGVDVDPVGDRDAERPAGRGRRGHVVVEPDGLVDGDQRVEAVLAGRADAEVEVDLRRARGP